MKSSKRAVLVLSYKILVNGNLKKVNRLWYPEADGAADNMATAIKESLGDSIQVRLAKKFEI